MVHLKLIVLRTSKPDELAKFYSLLGLQFDYHKHSNSPYHYSARIDETVFEIYPLTKNQPEADKTLRLGFTIGDFDGIIQTFKKQGIKFVSEPIDTEFGYLAIIEDLDGRKIELYKGHL